jgi:glycerophosphoryl diester phosphodiesterase
MRLLLISLASVFVVFILLLTTRLWGLGVVHVEFPHPFFEKKIPMILKVKSTEDIAEALKETPEVVFWLDVQTTADKKLIVFFKPLSEKDMSVEAYRGTLPFAYSYQQLANQNPKIQLLRDLVAAYPAQRFVLNILDNVEDVHLWTVEVLKGLEADKRIVLQSNFNVVMESIKKLEPFWLYGCSQADLMRFLTFESMWILSATPFKGDVYIAPMKLLNRPAFHATTIEEVHRRHKKVFLGPVLNKAQFDDASRLKADALIVENLRDYLSWARP